MNGIIEDLNKLTIGINDLHSQMMKSKYLTRYEKHELIVAFNGLTRSLRKIKESKDQGVKKNGK